MCAGIHHPTRGGTRGGKDQFDWEDVKTDKDRECYLGDMYVPRSIIKKIESNNDSAS